MGRWTLLRDIPFRVKLGAIAAALFLISHAPASAQENPEDDLREDYVVAVAKLPDDYVLPPGKEHLPRDVKVYVYPADEQAGEDPEKLTHEQRFRRKVVGREVVFQILNVIDTVQTIACLEQSDCYEMNPVFGRDPSAGKLIAMKALGGGIHAITTYWLSHSSERGTNVFQLMTIGVYSGVVFWNLQHAF